MMNTSPVPVLAIHPTLRIRCLGCGRVGPANARNPSLKAGQRFKLRCWFENKNRTHAIEAA